MWHLETHRLQVQNNFPAFKVHLFLQQHLNYLNFTKIKQHPSVQFRGHLRRSLG